MVWNIDDKSESYKQSVKDLGGGDWIEYDLQRCRDCEAKENELGKGWLPLSEYKDGERVLVSDNEHVWISSKKKGPSVGGQPTTGHDWYLGERGRYPVKFQPLPRP